MAFEKILSFKSLFNIHKKSIDMKTLSTMRGVIAGITSDRAITNIEIQFLDVWLRDIRNMKPKGDLLDLCEQVGDILEDGVITEDEREDTIQLLDDIIKYGDYNEDQSINETLGFISAISVDNEIHPKELQHLISNLKVDETAAFNKLLLSRIMGLNLPSDHDEILSTLKSISGQEFLDTGSVEAGSMSLLFDQHIPSSIEGMKCVVTGLAPDFNRAEINKIIRMNGGIPMNNVSGKTDLVIVGEIHSTFWVYTSFGRKLERAIEEKLKQHPVKIVSSSAFLDAFN